MGERFDPRFALLRGLEQPALAPLAAGAVLHAAAFFAEQEATAKDQLAGLPKAGADGRNAGITGLIMLR